jgi:hypothetical protein
MPALEGKSEKHTNDILMTEILHERKAHPSGRA